MSEPTLEYFFDYSCPYAYLGSTRIEQLAAEAGARLVWRPMLLGGVFRELGTPQNLAAALHPSKARHNALDMQRWAAVWGVPLRMPAGHPFRTVDALRATLAAPAERRADVIHRFYRAYWVEGADLARTEVLEGLLGELGLSRELAGPFGSDVKDALRANTDEAVSRGVFGAPSIFLNGQLYFGQDRLWMVARELGLEWAAGDDAHVPRGGALPEESESAEQTAPPLVFWYDFSSPFTYLAATQVRALSERTGAEVTWRPFLLGGLFRSMGGPDAPISTFPPAKTRYVGKDLERWAAYWRVPFRWPSRFPMRTLLPLRTAIALGPHADAFVQRTFEAYWAEDRDISDEATLQALLDEVGAPAGTLERTQDPAVKAELIANTEAAAQAGLFGAPTFTVGRHLFWGQDRMGFVERLARRR